MEKDNKMKSFYWVYIIAFFAAISIIGFIYFGISFIKVVEIFPSILAGLFIVLHKPFYKKVFETRMVDYIAGVLLIVLSIVRGVLVIIECTAHNMV